MTIELIDDGTRDTVLRCNICDEEVRLPYHPICERYADGANQAYDDWVSRCIEELEAEHRHEMRDSR